MQADDVVDVVYDDGQSLSVRTIDVAIARATRQFDFARHVFGVLDHHQPALLFEVQIDGADFSAKNRRDPKSVALRLSPEPKKLA